MQVRADPTIGVRLVKELETIRKTSWRSRPPSLFPRTPCLIFCRMAGHPVFSRITFRRGNVLCIYANSELGVARFFVAVPVDKPPGESFRLGFCLTGWRWKLCSAELPEQLQLRLAQEISKSEQR